MNDDRTFYEERYDDSFMDSGAFIPTHSKRLGILATALILQIYSDETKPFTQNMLVGWLADFGIVCGRKTVTYFYGHCFQGGGNFAPLPALLRFMTPKGAFTIIFAPNSVNLRGVRVQGF